MREDIKMRIEAVRHSEVPEGYSKDYCLMPNDWECVSLNRIAKKVSKKNKAGEDIAVLSNSAIRGIVFQRDYFEKDIANEENTDGYFVVEPKDYIYNPRISVHAPFGPINKNNLGCKGIVSPLYTVFRPQNPETIDEKYLEYFFLSTQWNRFVYTVSNQGVRFDRMNITDDDFFCMPIAIPPLAEQQKIAEILVTCDRVIELKQQLLEEMRRQKQWLMRMLLDPDSGVRLPGFESSKWSEHKLGDFGCCIRGVSYDPKKDLADSKSPSTVTLFRANNIGVDGLIEDDIQFVDNNRVSENQLVKPEDIAISMSSGSKKAVGKTLYIREGYENSCFGAFCAIFRSKYNAFIKHLFESSNYQKSLSIILEGTNICNLTNGDIESLVFWFPENDAEMRQTTSVLSAADKEIFALSKEIEVWKQKKKALMQLLLTGLVRTKY